MKEHPIIFSGPMVQAILSGTKTMTRRVIVPTQSKPKVAPLEVEPWMIDGKQEVNLDGSPLWTGYHPNYPTGSKWFGCPYGQAGDRLWVRETWTMHPNDKGADCLLFKADLPDPELYGPWRPSIFMPRWASRITLEITGVRVERVQDISKADCCAELGVLAEWPGPGPEPYPRNLRGGFAFLWDSINVARGYGWAVNPWVWVIGFRRMP